MANNTSEPQFIISKAVAMKLFDNYKKNKNLTTHQPYPMGAGGVAKFWTKNLAFEANADNNFVVKVKKNGKQSALIELQKYLGEEA